jgi:hypothetical protein
MLFLLLHYYAQHCSMHFSFHASCFMHSNFPIMQPPRPIRVTCITNIVQQLHLLEILTHYSSFLLTYPSIIQLRWCLNTTGCWNIISFTLGFGGCGGYGGGSSVSDGENNTFSTEPAGGLSNWKGFWKKWLKPNQGTNLASACRDWIDSGKSQVTMAGVPAETQTEHPKTNMLS